MRTATKQKLETVAAVSIALPGADEPGTLMLRSL
jgi:hypothetical protein